MSADSPAEYIAKLEATVRKLRGELVKVCAEKNDLLFEYAKLVLLKDDIEKNFASYRNTMYDRMARPGIEDVD